MEDSREIIVRSIDDPWLDEPTYWSLAEMNAVREMVEAINTSHLSPNQSYQLQVLIPDEDGFGQGEIVLTAAASSGIQQHDLQHLADGICRLVRPSRYIGLDDEDPEHELWSHVFTTPWTPFHQRLGAINLVSSLARGLGRTDFGIEAALAELHGWADQTEVRVA